MTNHKNIFAYIAGRLNGKQANRIEREAVDDAFLRDAIEGLEENVGAHEQNLQSLRRKLKMRTQITTRYRYWYLQDAAILIIFLSALGLLFSQIYETRTPVYYADLMNAPVEEEILLPLEKPHEETAALLPATPVMPMVSDIITIIDDEALPNNVLFDMQMETMSVDMSSYIAERIMTTEDVVEEEAIPYVSVEEKPKFIISGKDIGEKGFPQWVAQRLKYPEAAIEQGLRGKVLCSFVITAEGLVTDVKVIAGVHPLLDKEAVRVISSSPQWTPGMQRGRAVAVVYHVPVVFLLS